jgi:hypothetical protein
MKNLVIFGDSFSTNFTHKNDVLENESWPYLLSDKLNLNLLNYAMIGACNGEIINRFFKEYQNIKNGDIVIFEIGFYNRILDPFQNTTVAIGYDKRFSKIEMDFFEYKVLNLGEYIKQDLIKMEFIFDYLKSIGVEFYIWCIDKDLSLEKEKNAYEHFFYSLRHKFSNNIIKYNEKFSFFEEFVNKNPKYWSADSDKHLNKLGHNDFFLYLYQYMQPKLNQHIQPKLI